MTDEATTRLSGLVAEAERLLYTDLDAADRAAAEAAAACADADRAQAVLRVRAETVRLIVAGQRGQDVAAIDRGLRLVHQAAALEEHALEARLWNAIGACYDSLDLPERAVGCYERGLVLADVSADRGLVAKLRTNLGVAFSRMDEDERALEQFSLALEAAKAAGIADKMARLHLDVAESQRKLGRLDAARVSLDLARSLALEAGHVRSTAFVECEAGTLAVERGRAAEALGHLDAAVAAATANDQQVVLAEAHRLRSRILRTGTAPDPAAAVAAAEAGLAAARRLDTDEWRRKLHEELADAHGAAGDAAEALAHLRRAHELVLRQHKRQRDQELATLRVEQEVDSLRREQAALRAEREALSAANARLRQLSRENEDIVAVASHDLRNPLHLVTLLSEELTEGANGAHPVERIGEMLLDASNRMMATIDELIASHALASAREPPHEPVHLGVLARATVDALRPLAQAKDIRLSLQLSRPEPVVIATRAGVEQILDNLVGNALKFTPRGREVQVRVGTDGNDAVIEVLDEGPGLTDEDLDRVFGKWMKLSARPTGGEPSTGLGLYITHRRVTALGGEIHAARRTRRGARFTVRLPLAAP